MIEERTSFDSIGVASARVIRVMRPFCAVVLGLRSMFNYILPLKMFRQQNGLVDPKEVPLSIGQSEVTKIKTRKKIYTLKTSKTLKLKKILKF